jgi:2',3'-cyclic-nucleotide 2'-phosphodiesterase (5'-nucleotidase family)
VKNKAVIFSVLFMLAMVVRAYGADDKVAPALNPSEISETAVGDIVTDAMRRATGADAAIINAGSLGFLDLPSEATEENVEAFIPFDSDSVVVLKLNGADLLAALERSVSVLPRRFSGFLQMSGIAITVDPNQDKGSRIVSTQIDGESIKAERNYNVAVTGFLAEGGAGYLMLKNGDVVSKKAIPLRSVLVDNFKSVDEENVGWRINVLAMKKNGK